MAEPVPGRWRRRCGRFFRALRITLVLLLFFVVAAGVYLNEVGLPGFLKTSLLKKLHDRGLDLQFSRLRWHLIRGFVAEDVHFEPAAATPSDPSLFLKEVELKLNHPEFFKFQWTLDSLILRGGRIVWPLGETNGHPLSLSMTNIQAQLRLQPGDEWTLDHFTAAFAGAKMQFSGSLTNASSIQEWKIFQGGGGGQSALLRQRLRGLADELDRTRFSKAPELHVTLDGDARDPQSFQGLLTLRAAGARTPWGRLTNGTLVVRLTPPNATNHAGNIAIELRAADADTPWGGVTNGIFIAHASALDLTNYAANGAFEFQADEAGSPWASARNLRLSMRGARDVNATNIVRAVLDVQADNVATEWAQAARGHLAIRWTHSLTNAIPLEGTTELSLSNIHTRWVDVGEAQLLTGLDTPVTTGPRHADESWAWWGKLEPYSLDWNCLLKNIRSREQKPSTADQFELNELACGGLWRGPRLTVTNLSAELYGGHFAVQTAVDVATRVATFNADTDFDVQKITPFLPELSRNWLHQFSWENPPIAHGAGGVVLPAWTNRQPDWDGEVYPTLWMQGDFKTGKAAFNSIPVSSVQSHFSLTNVVWNLPDLVATRPEGNIELEHISDDRNNHFYFRVHSSVDPKILRPLLHADGQEGMDDFVFTRPPDVQAEIWGRWRDNSSIGFKAHASVTNLTFRHEAASSFTGDFVYTNQFMVLFNGRIERGSRYMTATALGVDFRGQRLFLTNGFSTMEAMPVAHAISRKVTQTIEPYQFLQPPIVHAHGIIPLVDEVPADLHFQIDGGPFHWMKFNLDHVSGEVNWVGDHMTVTNANASFYKGSLAGAAAFDFNVEPGTDFAFDATVTNADLHAMMADLGSSTNHLEGRLSGRLTVTHANSDDWKSWFGSGYASLRDGLIWDVPIFGRFSPYLDKVSRGLGESRASSGAGTFIITNSVIHSDTLEIRSPTFRLLYHGNVDFDGKVNSTMEAEVFHDVPLVGGIISTALLPFSKFFESKVTGTLDDPKIESHYIVSKILLAPFHPFRTLGEIFNPGGTNAPSETPPFPVNKPAPPPGGN